MVEDCTNDRGDTKKLGIDEKAHSWRQLINIKCAIS
jgi:hypothetical protein